MIRCKRPMMLLCSCRAESSKKCPYAAEWPCEREALELSAMRMRWLFATITWQTTWSALRSTPLRMRCLVPLSAPFVRFRVTRAPTATCRSTSDMGMTMCGPAHAYSTHVAMSPVCVVRQAKRAHDDAPSICAHKSQSGNDEVIGIAAEWRQSYDQDSALDGTD